MMPSEHYATSQQAYRTAVPGQTQGPASLKTPSAGRRTFTPTTATSGADNLRPRRRASSPPPPTRGKPEPQPPPPPPKLPSSPASSPSSSRPRRRPSAAAAAASPLIASTSFFLTDEPASHHRRHRLAPASRSFAVASAAAALVAAGQPIPPTPSSYTTASSQSSLSSTFTSRRSPTHTTASFVTDAPGPDRSNRESCISILDDPFFLRYDDYDPVSDPDSPAFSPLSASPPRSTADHQQTGGNENAASPSWPLPRRESLIISPLPLLVGTPFSSRLRLCCRAVRHTCVTCLSISPAVGDTRTHMRSAPEFSGTHRLSRGRATAAAAPACCFETLYRPG